MLELISNQFVDFFANLFDTSDFPPRWYCGKWSDFHGWIYIFSNLLIWLAYYLIPIGLLYFLSKQKQAVPFKKLIFAFIAFILACGTTHLMESIIFWFPVYRLNAILLVFTAMISVYTAYLLIKNLPKLLELKTPSQLIKEVDSRTKELNSALGDMQLISESLSIQNKKLENISRVTSHNLRIPVSNFSGLLHLLKDTKLTEEQQDYLNKLEEVTTSLTGTLDGLSYELRQSKAENIQRELLDFNKEIDNVLVQLSEDISKNNTTIIKELNCSNILYTKSYLESLLINLISNAIKYARPGVPPIIKIRTWVEHNEINLEISDNGLGIDLNRFKRKLFGLNATFHQNKNSRGVGLFLVKNQLDALGDKIDVQSVVNEGTTFTISFNSKSIPSII